jgi:hypothetical protein
VRGWPPYRWPTFCPLVPPYSAATRSSSSKTSRGQRTAVVAAAAGGYCDCMAVALRAQLRAVTVGQRACVGQLLLRVVCRLQRLAVPALEPLLCRLRLWAGLPPVRCPLCILRITHLPHPTAPPYAVRFRDRSAARVDPF